MRRGQRLMVRAAALLAVVWALSLTPALAQDSGNGEPLTPAEEALQEASGPEVTPPDAATLAAVNNASQGPEIPGIDMVEWEQLALRAELALDRGVISNESFEVLRSVLADYRAQFLEAQDLNAGRIATLRTQIAALGEPQEGVPELPSVAARRAALEAHLAELRAPVIAADEAHTRANGLIVEIDQVIRMRQAERLTEAGRSPLNPVTWGPALQDMFEAFGRLEREFESAFRTPSQRDLVYRSAPGAVFLGLLGLVMMLRGRRWAEQAVHWVMAQGHRGARVWAALIALGEIVVPFLGVVVLVNAVRTLDVLGLRGTLLLDEVPSWALAIIAARWLADRLFSQRDNQRMLPMKPRHRSEARTYATTLAVLVVAHRFMLELGAVNGFEQETAAVLEFPILVLTAMVLYRVGFLLRRKINFPIDGPDAPPPMRSRFVAILGRGAQVVAIVAPVLAGAGYSAAAEALIYPAVATLGLAGVLMVMQHFTSEFYRYAARQGDEEEDSLTTVLIGFVLVLAAVPILALIWGARVADLTELWTRFGEGFTIGETRFRPTDFLIFLLVFFTLYSATRIIQSALRNTILPKTTLDTGGRNAVVSGVGYIGIAIAAIASISATGVDLSALAFIFTALSVGIGFGLQNIVQNFVSGIILLIERPIAEGDWIEVNGNMGYVRSISVRSTRIETFDRTDVIVPNGDLISGTVTNYTRGNSIGRVIVPVGVAYGSDVALVESILLGVAREHDMVLMNPAPSVVFQGFGADSLDFEIRAILRDVNYVLSVKSDMNYKIYKRFAEAGIEIPFAQRDVWLRNPEVLTGGAARSPAADHDDAESGGAAAEMRPPQQRLSDQELGVTASEEAAGAEGDGEGDVR